MLKSKWKVGACLVAAVASGCAADGPVDEGEVGDVSQGLYSSPGVLLWTSRIVPMCWHTDQFANAAARTAGRNAIQQAVESSWAKVTDLRVTWEECPTTGVAQHVRVKIETQPDDPIFNGNTIQLGRAALTTPAQRIAPADPAGLLINIDPNWNATQGGRNGLASLVRHEMGHILGFNHEMERPDFVGTGVNDCKPASIPGGSNFMTAADNSSLMASGRTYCNNNINLSAG